MSNIKVILALLLLCSSGLYAQQGKTTFDSKKHKDTSVNKSTLNPIIKSGKSSQKHFLYNQKFGDNKPALNTLLKQEKNTKTKNFHKVIRSKESGLPIFISTPSSNYSSGARIETRSDKRSACYSYLKELSSVTKIKNPEQQFEIIKTEIETNGRTHIRLCQKYQGIKIYGSEAIVHLNAAGYGEIFNGQYILIDQNVTIDLKPAISSQDAISSVLTDLTTKTTVRTLTEAEKKLLDYHGAEVDTVVYQDKALVNTYLLAYHISLYPNSREHWQYLVDAKKGKIIEAYKHSCHVDGPQTASATDLNGATRTINTYLEGSTYIMADFSKPMFDVTDSSGLIITLDANRSYGNNFDIQPITSSNNTWPNATAVSAHYNASVAYDYYKNVHGRSSIDGNGGTIYSVINVVEDDGSEMDNAYWNGKYMSYGNGNSAFKPLAGGIDVGGHEMTHGVVQNTANLKYQGESGAINESMADIFGFMMDTTDWLIGEDVVLIAEFPSGALRSLSDPHNGGSSLSDPGYQPRHMNEKYTGAQDNGGVHINSGIPNWAFYKFATAIGSNLTAAKIYYRALTVYLTQNSQFIDLRLAVIQAATDLYGSAIASEAGLAFDAVGIVDGQGTGGGSSTLPVNPGTGYLLSYDTNPSLSSVGLLRSNPQATTFANLTTKTVYNKPSVTDDGSICVYVGTDHKIHILDPTATVVNNQILQGDPIWSSVAISKDGLRLAAITMDDDTSIYVFDITTSNVVRYQLYNPTFSDGVKSNGPVYADAIEWDYSGEYLIYDCYNVISSSGQEDITYWDINLINVWDKTLDDFGSGEVFKLFNQLEPGESLGNPVFSKNSPNIIAFDYENANTGDYAVFGLDLEKNDLDVIAITNYLGWPSYNKTDAVLAFTSTDGIDLNVYSVALNPDKISSGDTPGLLVDQAMWPVYFAKGTRDLSTGIQKSNDVVISEIKLYPNPTKGELSISFDKNIVGELSIEVCNQLGQVVYKTTQTNFSDDRISFNTSEFHEGIYIVHIKGDNFISTGKFVKQGPSIR